MKILYDHQIFTSQVYGGISRYFCELIAYFTHQRHPEFELALSFSNNAYLRKASFPGIRPFFPNRRFTGKTTIITTVNSWKSIRSLKTKKYDIFHPTNYDPYFLDYIGTKPFVVTVYDLIHEIYPELFPSDIKTKERKRLLVQKAHKIIAISEKTKKDLLRFYNIDEQKISVIYLANSLATAPKLLDTLAGAPERYLFFVGERKHYKNFNFMVKALAPLFKREQDLCLVCAGGGIFSSDEIAFLVQSGIGNRAFQFSVDDTALAFLYQHATAFIFPSRYEGFGIPVLEAFACGCPAILSGSSSLPEVGGDAAIYFDPCDEDSLRQAVSAVLHDSYIRSDFITRGMTQLGEFSWAKTAQETRAVYESIC